jgi:hypothetical protein
MLGCLALALAARGAAAGEWFIAPDGDDARAGTREAPFATFRRAQDAARPGDTVWVRGGVYRMAEAAVARKRGIFASVILLDKSGEPGRPIRYAALSGEQPRFDFSAVKPEGFRVSAFHVTGSWLCVEGLEVTGVQVTLTNHTQSICFENAGSHNVFERLVMRDGMGIGYYSVRGSDNLVLNCDAFRNHDPVSDGGRGGNVDGFGCHPAKGGTNNVFRGCRAWFNSDDGYDCINAREAVTFDRCWAFWNGYSDGFVKRADGNGFKAGGYGGTPAARLPSPVPRHRVTGCFAYRNKAAGFYANHHPGGCDWIGNTAGRNGKDFSLLGRLDDNVTDVPGTGHVLVGNTAWRGRANLVNIDTNRCSLSGNRFGIAPPALDERLLTASRAPDGGLPPLAE